MTLFAHTACDAAIARALPAVGKVAHPNFVLLTTILASALAFVDGSVVNVGLPAIGAALAAREETLQWIVNAYLLPLSALLLFGGAAGDRFGRRRLLIWGIAAFALASAACAASPDSASLLAARAVQGAGAAILLPNSLAILGEAFEGSARGRAIGIWAAMGAVIGAVGPVLGGWLIDTVGWRAIFLLNLPLAIAAIALAVLYVPKQRLPDESVPLDALGASLATIGLGALTWGLTVGAGRTGWTPAAVIAIVVAAATLVVFVYVERLRGKRAMMPLALFSSATFIGLTLLTLFLYAALGGLIVLLPYALITAWHFSATGAGAALLPLPLIIALASPLMGSAAARIGARAPLTAGPLIVAAGFLLFLRMDNSGDYAVILPAIVVISLGMSLAVAPLTTAVLASVDSAHTGSASGFNSAVARIGGLVATALLGGVLTTTGPGFLDEVHGAAIAGAAAAAGAALCVLALVGRPTTGARSS